MADRSGKASRRNGAIGGLAVGLMATLATALAIWVDGQIEDQKITSRAQQPRSVTYPDNATYYAGVIESRTLFLRRSRPYEVKISRDPDLTYGHPVKLDPLDFPPEISGAEWRAEGVRLRFKSGHELFVPAGKFLGGR